MHCHCGTNNRAPRWTHTDPCKPEVRPGAREESVSPAWLAESIIYQAFVFGILVCNSREMKDIGVRLKAGPL